MVLIWTNPKTVTGGSRGGLGGSLPSADTRRVVVKLKAKVCAQSTCKPLSQACPEKKCG